jgi:hypothetical protein
MNHSFLCIVGCHVYPTFAFMSFACPWDADFDRFVRQPSAELFEGMTFSVMT